VEIVPKSGVYDYAARYTAGATEYFVPARLATEVGLSCTATALRAAKGLHLRGVTRVDAIVDAKGRPWVLEVNVSPGMTETSLLPMAAQAAGWSLAELCEHVLNAALDK
jgi:D-alanine-D-alanine ligase